MTAQDSSPRRSGAGGLGEGRIAILGTGLIGGSIGLAIRGADPGRLVSGFDRDPSAARRAAELGAVSEIARSAQEAAEGAALVVVCLPVDQIPDACDLLAEHIPPETTVTDVGSAKREIVRRGELALGEGFVGGHPMAGSERHGIEGADADLFEDSSWLLTPTHQTSSRAYEAARRLATMLGARPVAVDPEVHDALVARLSHLPQLAASALVEVATSAGDGQSLLGVAAGGFRDVTRIAASDPNLWVTIIRANREAVVEGLGGFGAGLERIRRVIEEARWEELGTWLERARAARVDLFAKPLEGGEPVDLGLLVPDRPGVLAEVTTAAGELGANIEDLRIVHSPEGGRGRLELVIAGEEPARVLTAALEGLGYRVETHRRVDG